MHPLKISTQFYTITQIPFSYRFNTVDFANSESTRGLVTNVQECDTNSNYS